jgi:hypothetical protein
VDLLILILTSFQKALEHVSSFILVLVVFLSRCYLFSSRTEVEIFASTVQHIAWQRELLWHRSTGEQYNAHAVPEVLLVWAVEINKVENARRLT